MLCYLNVHLIKNLNTTYTKFLDIQKRKEQVRKNIYIYGKERMGMLDVQSDLVLE